MANHNYTYRWLSGNKSTTRETTYGVSSYSHTDHGWLYSSAVKTGTPNADYETKLQLGLPVGSAYSRLAYRNVAGIPSVSWSVSYAVSSVQSVAKWGNWISPYRYSDANRGTAAEFDAAYFIASNTYYDWLAKGVGQFEGLTFAGEFPKLLASLAYRSRALAEAQEYYSRKFLRRLRPLYRRFAKLKRPLTNKERIKLKTGLSGYYLEYWFGMYPFLKSLEALSEAFDVYESPYLVVSGSGAVRRKDIETVIGIDGGGDTSLSAVTTTRYDVKVKLTGWYRIENLFDLNLRLGFTLDDIAVAGWELVPLSWLADYWIPIGDFLASRKYYHLQPDMVFITKTTTRTHWISGVRETKVDYGSPATYSYSLLQNRGRDISTLMDRNVGNEAPIPKTMCLLDMSTWGDGPSAQQRSYIAAVAATMTKRLRRLTKLL